MLVATGLRDADGFASILPALAFSLDMFQNTDSNYGVNEVLLASVLGAVVFSLFAGQPLVIVGVTGMHDAPKATTCFCLLTDICSLSRSDHSLQLVGLPLSEL